MFHISPETLRKYPIVGVLIGGATAVVVGYFLQSGLPELRALLGQKTPEPVSVHDVVSRSGVRWVTLAEGQWHCEQAITTRRRSALMRLLRGPIETTQVPITGAVEGEVVVASIGGAMSCVERAGSPLTGV